MLWLLAKIDEDLNVLETKSFTASQLGYGFMINGSLFTSNSFNSNLVSNRFDFASGSLTSVNFTLAGLSSPYITNAFYDSALDRLYVHDRTTSVLYSSDGAAEAFGVQVVSPVPEPSSLALMSVACLVGFVAYFRRQRRVAA